MRINKKRILLSVVIISILFLAVFGIWENNTFETKIFTYQSEKVQNEFDGYKIVQVSDLHNYCYGKYQKKLISKIKSLKPDMIAVTGDLINYDDVTYDNAENFISQAVMIAPIYFVTGNHEKENPQLERFLSVLKRYKVNVIDDSYVDIKKGEGSIRLIGIGDTYFKIDRYKMILRNKEDVYSVLNPMTDKSVLNVLLAHQPEMFDIYAACGADVVLSGHAHGGQFRIPYCGGAFAPNQGFFPKYTSGRYDLLKSTMYLSRGLGNTSMPIRIFNRPQLCEIILKSE